MVTSEVNTQKPQSCLCLLDTPANSKFRNVPRLTVEWFIAMINIL